jgi:hypothetical protein
MRMRSPGHGWFQPRVDARASRLARPRSRSRSRRRAGRVFSPRTATCAYRSSERTQGPLSRLTRRYPARQTESSGPAPTTFAWAGPERPGVAALESCSHTEERHSGRAETYEVVVRMLSAVRRNRSRSGVDEERTGLPPNQTEQEMLGAEVLVLQRPCFLLRQENNLTQAEAEPPEHSTHSTARSVYVLQVWTPMRRLAGRRRRNPVPAIRSQPALSAFVGGGSATTA